MPEISCIVTQFPSSGKTAMACIHSRFRVPAEQENGSHLCFISFIADTP
jgi:hypothetical protein